MPAFNENRKREVKQLSKQKAKLNQVNRESLKRKEEKKEERKKVRKENQLSQQEEVEDIEKWWQDEAKEEKEEESKQVLVKISGVWTEEEYQTLLGAIVTFGNDPQKIKECLQGSKSIKQINKKLKTLD